MRFTELTIERYDELIKLMIHRYSLNRSTRPNA